ncbi:MAG: Methyltransferase family protein [Candidatus Woesebacteria bacterium GW2011_GWA1_37_8]|uniref:Methyltransferase family protein n=2 Tax=Candidatus Woeseibacteriota TaxID=1752722 RepID=A0A0G0NM20_9BACT|nr:MAG: Methyltransferase family protein [Microgenomates group bacterium GW2011_GWC1_37_12b]KKQ44438.1 MAG: Methyltransferase family protein [Candidatus Woesebacteria bacterium GW2011_GWA1_37_8]KKQ86969.1 MAG: Methyltransferase family protein [Candidatus Woesebacteria bacterium GW2011_GWB1_38_8b]
MKSTNDIKKFYPPKRNTGSVSSRVEAKIVPLRRDFAPDEARGKDTTTVRLRELYQDKFKKYGDDPKSLLWKRKGAAHQRFRQFWAEIDFNNKKVLDIGCGFGEFGIFLVKRYKNVNYTGIDIVPEFINVGKKKYPNLNLAVADYLTDKIKAKFDVVIASGVLNSNVSNNMKFREKAIAKMFSLTSDVLAFNMLGGHPQPKFTNDSNVWYADSLEILNYCLSLTRRVILRANYNPHDFTIFMYKVKKSV